MVTPNEQLHYSRFFVHRSHSSEEDDQFKAARFIQSYLLNEAAQLGVQVFENSDKVNLNI